MFAQMPPDRAEKIKSALQRADLLGLGYEDFLELELPLFSFACTSKAELGLLKSHVEDKAHTHTTAAAKQAFIGLLQQRWRHANG